MVAPLTLSFSKRRTMSSAVLGSRFPVGSSAMMSRGSWIRARAIATRCFSPPESMYGKWCLASVRPTVSSTSGTRFAI